MQPLIDKFGINPETNKLFVKICELFHNKPNYQVWGVKMVFSQAISYVELEEIAKWVDGNGGLISKLSKQNIVSYSNKKAISTLFKEIHGLEMMSFIKNMASRFNTEQKAMLIKELLPPMSPLEACDNPKIVKWFKIFNAFSKKPMSIKNRFYSSSSAIKNIDSLLLAINECLSKTYNWKCGKEDLLAFIEHNTPDCDIVFNEGQCVIVQVPSFESSFKLAGSGKTAWCLSREASYFNSYLTSYSNRNQFFLFDFSRKECDAFAKIGFTVEDGSRIVEAQTSHNFRMLDEKFIQGEEAMDINDVLTKLKVPMSIFMRLPKNFSFKWEEDYFIKLVRENPDLYSMPYCANGQMIINVLNYNGLGKIVQKTALENRLCDMFEKSFLFLDFNKPLNDGFSFIMAGYKKDSYGLLEFYTSFNIYGLRVSKKDILSQFGITEDVFLKQHKLAPSIMLHKLIDDGDEASAIELIRKEGKNIDVNYEYRCKVPIYYAITKGMVNLFEAIIMNDNFKENLVDGFGETLLQSILYALSWKDIVKKEQDIQRLKSMANIIIDCGKFDLNAVDYDKDTAFSIACCFPNENWAVKRLANNKNVNINTVNEFNNSPLSNCILNKNLGALRIIGQRPDLVVNKNEANLAKKMKINLDDYINPNPCFFDEEISAKKESLEYAFSMANYN